MRFQVSRTSVWDRDTAPCKEAVRCDGFVVDKRTFKSVEEYTKHLGDRDPWEGRGENHRVTKTGIARDLPRSYWAIEVDGLDQLLALCRKYGSLVIQASDVVGVPLELEIYDGYRE